ncbi:MAG: hypothetical protein AAF802_00245 [Planctomycetota bacterium]
MTRDSATVLSRLRFRSRALIVESVAVEKPMCIVRNVRTLIAAPQKRASMA